MNLENAQPERKPRIVILISGSGSNMAALADAVRAGQIDCDIAAVMSNKAEVAGLTKAQDRDIPTRVLSHKDYASREAYDAALIQQIDSLDCDLIVLAGFMRVLSPSFVQHYADRILNIHPSLLPKYQGLHTHERVLEAGDSEHGVTVHFVNEILDDGANVIQAVVPVLAEDTATSLQQKVHVQEHVIYPIAVKWFVEGRLKYRDSKAWLDGKALPATGLRL
ncbi:MAG: hypothetical protein RL217_90 [Pseudomonadota bacterium]|jgi:phosphoribosylglycinamide formyltransferase-1